MVSAVFKSYGIENGGFFKSVSRVCKKKKPGAFAELSSMVQQMEPNPNQKCLLL